jgi:hypothetical protein
MPFLHRENRVVVMLPDERRLSTRIGSFTSNVLKLFLYQLVDFAARA